MLKLFEKYRSTYYEFKLKKDFLNETKKPKLPSQTTTYHIRLIHLTKLKQKTFLHQSNHKKKKKKKDGDWKVSAADNKGLMSRIYNKLLQINRKRQTKQFFLWTKGN